MSIMAVTKLKSSATRSRKTVAAGFGDKNLTPERSNEGRGFASATG